MVDFNKLLNEDATPAPLNPADIFHSLPRADTKYDYLRDVQGEVLKAWHVRRKERDIVRKKNRGPGTPLGGLLIPQPLLQEEAPPPLSPSQTKQLAKQFYQPARNLTPPAVTDGPTTDLPHEFLNSEAIYVTTFK